MRRARGWIAGIVGLALASAAAGQSTIELRAAARVEASAPVTLERVAVLTGPEARALAGTVVLGAGATATTLGVEQVREILEQGGAGGGGGRVNWGRVVLRGASCRLIRVESGRAGAKEAAPKPPALEVPRAGTVRAGIESRLRSMAGVEAGDIRVTFSPGDEDILGLSADGRTLEVRVGSVSERLPLAVALYDRDRVVAERTIRVGVEVRREVLTARGAIRRGHVLTEGDVALEARWAAWDGREGMALTRADVAGRTARRALAAGEAIDAESLVQPMAARKGEIIQVRSVAGSVVVTTKARALAAARVGELTPCEGLEGGPTFLARMDSPGRGIVSSEGVR
ncbi:MAG: flagellar basal body P-ring formation protein FlgA [Phycisphaerae bacterium]|nr:flagellar basal body P-ring formation protein FlgA [Phycisphaerae bacterium]